MVEAPRLKEQSILRAYPPTAMNTSTEALNGGSFLGDAPHRISIPLRNLAKKSLDQKLPQKTSAGRPPRMSPEGEETFEAACLGFFWWIQTKFP